jgi:hypothetical protein
MAAPSAARSSGYFSVLGAPTRRRVPPPHNPDRQSRQAPSAPGQHHHSVRELLLTVAHRRHGPDGGPSDYDGLIWPITIGAKTPVTTSPSIHP